MWRASDGKMRFDTPNTSIISDPGSQKTIMLDHLKKEATIIPTPPAAPGAPPAGMPKMPAGAAPAPPMQVQDLGKSTIEGHAVEGKRYTLPPMAAPPKPAMPSMKMPAAPKMPGASAAPKAPAAPAASTPKLPPGPSVTEVWTSTKLKTPVLTKVTTPAGEQTTYCKPTSMEEPHPSLFQVPAGYKIKPPVVPKVPALGVQSPKVAAPSAPTPKPPKL
jgi:hypothetical protein